VVGARGVTDAMRTACCCVRALGRIGSAYQKLDNLPEAIKYYGKSLTEHRTPEILAKLQEAEKEKKRRDREAYIDPAKADEAREQGNAHFKNGDWPSAVTAYTYVRRHKEEETRWVRACRAAPLRQVREGGGHREAINRNPTDVRTYTNRAATYIKLLAFPEAGKDCEEAIRLDPTYGARAQDVGPRCGGVRCASSLLWVGSGTQSRRTCARRACTWR
jgi:stress-induced-phosphoprotein 1